MHSILPFWLWGLGCTGWANSAAESVKRGPPERVCGRETALFLSILFHPFRSPFVTPPPAPLPP